MAFKIKGGYDTEIYVTNGGYVAIKQPDIDGDQMVLLAAHQLADIISELQSFLDDRTAWEFGSNEEPNAKPPEG